MSNARWYRAAMVEAPATPKARWYRAALTGSALATPKVRWYRAALSGAAAVAVAPLAAQSVEPESIVTVSAALVGGGAADSWTFRRISGPVVGIEGSGATRTFIAPSTMAGGVVVVGIRATVDGIQSPEVTCSITVAPQASWWWTGSQLIGARSTFIP